MATQKGNRGEAWRRLHPSFIFHSKWLLLPPTAAIGTIGIFATVGLEEERLLVVLFVATLIFKIFCYLPIFAYLLLRQYWYRFKLLDDRLVVRVGLFAVNHKVILYENLHGLDTTKSLLHRIFGTVKVSLRTRSTMLSEIDLRSVRSSVAEELRELLTRYQENRSHQLVSISSEGESGQINTNRGLQLHSMPVWECCKLSFVRTRAAMILSAIATFLVARFSQIGSVLGENMSFRFPIGPIDMTIIGGWIPWIKISILEGVDIWELSIFFVVVTCAFVMLLSVMSLVLAVSQFYNFRLSLDNTILRGESGLLIRAIQNTPLHRIQAIRILSTVRSRLLKRESIWFGTSAMPAFEADRNLLSFLSNWLVPLVPISKTREITKCVLPPDVDFEKEYWETVNVSRVWKRRFNLHLTWVVTLSALFVLVSWWLLIMTVLLMGWAVLISKLYAKSLSLQMLDNAIMFRKGYWSRTWTIVPFDKIQAVRLTQNPFDRRLNMATLNIDVAAYGTLSFPKHLLRIPYLHVERCREMLEVLILEASHRENEW